jgi:hypothetical protein
VNNHPDRAGQVPFLVNYAIRQIKNRGTSRGFFIQVVVCDSSSNHHEDEVKRGVWWKHDSSGSYYSVMKRRN